MALTTTIDSTNITEAEFDTLWEGNKTRMFTHQSWPPFHEAEKAGTGYADNEADAKVSMWNFLELFFNNSENANVAFLEKIKEDGVIRGILMWHSLKSFDGSYSFPDDVDMKKLWEAHGQSGDWRDDTLQLSATMCNDLADGTASGAWLQQYMYDNQHALAAAFKASGKTQWINVATGKVQKAFVMKGMEQSIAWETDGLAGTSTSPGLVRERLAVFGGYVDDNATPIWTLGMKQNDHFYSTLAAEHKPCGWPFTTQKVGGKYPPYD